MSWLKRQSFLGPHSEQKLARTNVGIVGLGGGGSHIGQQLAHAGLGRFLLIDPDIFEDHNRNRLIGGWFRFVAKRLAKVEIARRLIKDIQPTARIVTVKNVWQSAIEQLRECDVIFGCVDSFSGRDELERFCRQHLIPYIDIGMDVTEVGADYLVAGQVLLSCPGEPCLRCVGVITDDRLKREAEQYGAAGARPQVVWPNAILASTAVGFLIQLITPWHSGGTVSAYREYDANTSTVRESPKWPILLQRRCTHHPEKERGDPSFDIRRLLAAPRPELRAATWMELLREFFARRFLSR